jgi:hypothetical protein
MAGHIDAIALVSHVCVLNFHLYSMLTSIIFDHMQFSGAMHGGLSQNDPTKDDLVTRLPFAMINEMQMILLLLWMA